MDFLVSDSKYDELKSRIDVKVRFSEMMNETELTYNANILVSV